MMWVSGGLSGQSCEVGGLMCAVFPGLIVRERGHLAVPGVV